MSSTDTKIPVSKRPYFRVEGKTIRIKDSYIDSFGKIIENFYRSFFERWDGKYSQGDTILVFYKNSSPIRRENLCGEYMIISEKNGWNLIDVYSGQVIFSVAKKYTTLSKSCFPMLTHEEIKEQIINWIGTDGNFLLIPRFSITLVGYKQFIPREFLSDKCYPTFVKDEEEEETSRPEYFRNSSNELKWGNINKLNFGTGDVSDLLEQFKYRFSINDNPENDNPTNDNPTNDNTTINIDLINF